MKIKKAVSVFLAVIFTCMTFACSTTPQQEDIMKQIIPDINFSKGFRLTGYDSRFPEQHNIGSLNYGSSEAVKTPWRIGQWGCTKNLIDATYLQKDGVDIYEDGSKQLKINRQNGAFSLNIDGSKDYTQDRKDGEAWIHYIIEVMPFDTFTKLSEIEYLTYYLEFTLNKAVNKNVNFNPELHTALFIWYITVADKNPLSPTCDDYFWFGLPIYDYRYDYSPFFAQQDSGKEDRTNQFIVTPDGRDFMDSEVIEGVPQVMSRDVLPQLKSAFKLSQERGFMKGVKYENLSITSMYIGWELPGNFDVGMDVDKMGIYVNDKAPIK